MTLDSSILPDPAAYVLVVEDTTDISDVVATALRFDGCEVEVAATGAAAYAALARRRPDLVILDVMLPDTDGFAIQRQLVAEGSPPPVIFLTARDDSVDVVRGLELGADDYVRKPFGLDELIARVHVVLRRSASAAAAAADSAPASVAGPALSAREVAPDERPLEVHDLTLNPLTREVTRAGVAHELTPREFSLLEYLMRNAGVVLSKGQILDAVWNYDFGGDGNVLETYIGYLRRKIDKVDPRLIHTSRGIGYCLRPPRTNE